MTQTDPKQNEPSPANQTGSVLARLALAIAGGASTFALSVPLATSDAAADWRVTSQYYPGGSIRTYRRIGPGGGMISHLKEPAPGNNCRLPAFEVLNPKEDEARCVGLVVPHWSR